MSQRSLSFSADERKPAAMTVGQLTAHIRALLDNDDLLADVSVRGEVSNFKRYSSGHLYFTLKDAAAQLPCAMWQSDAARLKFQPEDGARVVCRGHVSVYDKQGKYQFYVTSMKFDGVGALFEQFERLKRKLEAEGLFDPARKRPLPKFPGTIGLATSTSGAAIRDLLSILRRRSPSTNIVVFPTVVQGPEAPVSIVRSIRMANQHGGLDVLIVGRGGGSIEDLWAFNDERVARAAAKSAVPIVSAVGHETDFTILDFVADLRAPTPSAAAELVAPDRAELQRRVRNLSLRATRALRARAERARLRLRALLARRIFTQPQELVARHRQQVDELWESSLNTMTDAVARRVENLRHVSAQLIALDPRAVLRRGYSIFESESGGVIASVRDAEPGGSATVILLDGRVRTTIDSCAEEPL